MQDWLTRKNVFRSEWSLGLYEGDSPFALSPHPQNPILTTRQMGKNPARFIADPFLLARDNRLYLFFELLNLRSRKGEIAVAVRTDQQDWQVLGIVLAEAHHLSFPLVFEYGKTVYMLPESHQTGQVTLYRATAFPHGWEPVSVLLEGAPYSDAVLLFYHGRWWLFATADNTRLQLFSSMDLLRGPWTEHPQSPVYTGVYARPAGKMLVYEDRIYRFAQNPVPAYGTSIMAFAVQTLTPDAYVEEMLPDQPFLGPSGQGWNEKRMHHVDFLQTGPEAWLAVADGYSHALDTRWSTYPLKIRERYLQSRDR